MLALISFKFKNKFNLNIFIKNSANFFKFLIWNLVLTHKSLNSKAKIQLIFQDTSFFLFFFQKMSKNFLRNRNIWIFSIIWTEICKIYKICLKKSLRTVWNQVFCGANNV